MSYIDYNNFIDYGLSHHENKTNRNSNRIISVSKFFHCMWDQSAK